MGTAAWLVFGYGIGYLMAPVAPRFPDVNAGPFLTLLASALAIFILLTFHGAAAIPHRDRLLGWESVALSFLIGAAIHATVAAWFGFLVITPVLLLVAGLVFSRVRGGRKLFWSQTWILLDRRPARFAALALFVLLLLAAMAPPVESDGLRYHLAAPQEWLHDGRFTNIPYSANSNLPSLMGILTASTAGLAWQGRMFPMLHAAFTGALALVCGALARRLIRTMQAAERRPDFQSQQRAGDLAMLSVFAVPAVAIVGAWPFSDVAGAALLFGGILASLPYGFQRRSTRLWTASLLLGSALAAKLSLLPLVGMVGLWLLARELFNGRQRPLALALLLVPGALSIAPWLLKNLLYHGNPVYPVAWGVFGGPEWSAANDEFYKGKLAEKGMGRSLLALILSPWNVTAHYTRFESQNPGPWVLAMVIPAAVGLWLSARGRLVNWLNGPAAPLALVLIPGWLIWFQTYQSVRFLMPQILALIVLGIPVVVYLASLSGMRKAATVILLIPIGMGSWWTVSYRLAVDPVYLAATGLFNQEIYASSKFNSLPVIRWLNENTKDDEPVIYIGEHRIYFAEYRPIASDWFDTPRILVEFRQTDSNGELLDRWRSQGVRYVLYNEAELSLYEQHFFQPRFSGEEWLRFQQLREQLLEDVAFRHEVFSRKFVYALSIQDD